MDKQNEYRLFHAKQQAWNARVPFDRQKKIEDIQSSCPHTFEPLAKVDEESPQLQKCFKCDLVQEQK